MESDWAAALLLGLLQGVAEWLPVSSEGMVAVIYSLAYGRSLGEGVEYALWLHAGTIPAALVALRAEVSAVVRNVMTSPASLSPATAFLLLTTAVSGIIGLPLLLLITTEGDNLAGPPVMALIGAAMLATAAAQLLRPGGGQRDMSSAGRLDALLAGLAQGISVIPGFSRSGLTLAALLGRKFPGRDALTLSFLMSIPVSLGAAIYVGLSSGVRVSPESLAALAVAFAVGLMTIRALLRLAERLNYGWFLLAVGGAMLAGAVWQLVG